VDECGHAMEATALVPIAGLQGPLHKPSQIVLSGDPRQLGPVVRSPVAQQLGLGNKLLYCIFIRLLYLKTNKNYTL